MHVTDEGSLIASRTTRRTHRRVCTYLIPLFPHIYTKVALASRVTRAEVAERVVHRNIHFAAARSDESPGKTDCDLAAARKLEQEREIDSRTCSMDPVKKRARAPPIARSKHAVCAIKLIGMTSLLLRVGRLSLCAPEPPLAHRIGKISLKP